MITEAVKKQGYKRWEGCWISTKKFLRKSWDCAKGQPVSILIEDTYQPQSTLIDDADQLQSILIEDTVVFILVEDAAVSILVEDADQPRFLPARKVSYSQQQKLEEEVARLQVEGVIKLVRHSHWALPIVPFLKDAGSLRICGDYKRTVNQVCHVAVYPLPRIENF